MSRTIQRAKPRLKSTSAMERPIGPTHAQRLSITGLPVCEAASGSQPKPERIVARVHSSSPHAPARPAIASKRAGRPAPAQAGKIQRSSSSQPDR